MSIPLIVDGVTDADSFIMNQIIDAANAGSRADSRGVDVRAHGAIGNGSHDDTDAFDEAWDAALTASLPILIPPGRFTYTGAGLSGSAQPAIIGSGVGASSVLLDTTSYLFAPSALTNFLLMRDLTIEGGFGAISHTFTGINTVGHHVIENCRFYNYTRAAIETNSSDFPYWKFKNCMFWGKDTLLTVGLALAGLTDQCSFIDCSFVHNRVGIKLADGGNNAEILNCDFLRFSTDRTNGPCTDIWLVADDDSNGAGPGLVIRDSKFGNENLVAGDHRILVADAGSGASFGQQFPVLDADSTGYVTGVAASGNYWAGTAGTDDDGFVYSTTPNLIGWNIGPLTIGGANPTQIIKYRTVPTGGERTVQTNTVGPVYPAVTLGTEDKPAPRLSNVEGAAYPLDPNYLLATQPNISRLGPGTPANYSNRLTTALGSFSLGSGSSKSGTTDALGGSDAITAVMGTTLYQLYGALTTTLLVGVPLWIELDVKEAASTPLAEITLGIVDDNVFLWTRTVAVPAAGWHTYKFPFIPRITGTSPYLTLTNPTGSSGQVDLGRARVYHATEPLLGGTIGAANADTSGATLGQLETEVNELKALLRQLGVMAA